MDCLVCNIEIPVPVVTEQTKGWERILGVTPKARRSLYLFTIPLNKVVTKLTFNKNKFSHL